MWAPNQVFAGDITYVATGEGFLFLAIFLDIFTRKIVGFAAEDNMRKESIIEALNMALSQQDVKPGETIAHSDRGSLLQMNIETSFYLQGLLPTCPGVGTAPIMLTVKAFFIR